MKMRTLCGTILAAVVACASGALGSDFTSRITWETLSSFCHSNVADVKVPVRGIVVEHHGLGCVWFKPDEQKGWRKDLAEKGIVIVHPHYHPWCWMNDAAVRFSDRIVDCIIEHYALEPNTKVCSKGGSMGGLGALVYARYSRKNVVAVVANCPVCDLPYHYTERPDLPRTLTTAFADAPDFDAALKAHSPIDLVPQMPDISYFVAHSTADKSVNKERHSDRFVEAMRKAGRRVEYAISEGTGHCQLTPEVQRRFDAAVLSAFDTPETDRTVAIHSATTNGVDGEWVWIDGRDLPLEGRAYASPNEAETPYDRLPKARKEVISAAVWGLQQHTAGMCFRLRTDSSRLRIFWKPRFANLSMWHMPSTGVSGVDVYQLDPKSGWQYVKPPWPAPPKFEGAAYTWENLVPGAPIIVYLPLYNGISGIRFGVEAGKRLEPLPPPAVKPVVFYGTSTTQGGCVSRPGFCETSVVGRMLDVPVVNLGFSGSGKMERGMIDVIADVEASVYVLDTFGNMKPDTIVERYEDFVRGLRSRRPGVPIVLTANGWIFNDVCREKAALIRGIWEKLRAENPVEWANLFFVGDFDGPLAVADATVEGVHLNDIGSVRAGRVFGEAVREALNCAELVRRAECSISGAKEE